MIRVSWAMVSQVLSTSGVGGLEYRSAAALCTNFQLVFGMTAMRCYDAHPVVMDSLVFVQRTRSLCHVGDVMGCLRYMSTVGMMCRGESTRESVSARMVHCHVPVVFGYTLRSIPFHSFGCGSRSHLGSVCFDLWGGTFPVLT